MQGKRSPPQNSKVQRSTGPEEKSKQEALHNTQASVSSEINPAQTNSNNILSQVQQLQRNLSQKDLVKVPPCATIASNSKEQAVVVTPPGTKVGVSGEVAQHIPHGHHGYTRQDVIISSPESSSLERCRKKQPSQGNRDDTPQKLKPSPNKPAAQLISGGSQSGGPYLHQKQLHSPQSLSYEFGRKVDDIDSDELLSMKRDLIASSYLPRRSKKFRNHEFSSFSVQPMVRRTCSPISLKWPERNSKCQSLPSTPSLPEHKGTERSSSFPPDRKGERAAASGTRSQRSLRGRMEKDTKSEAKQKISSLERCIDETSYDMPFVTSAFLPVPVQQKPKAVPRLPTEQRTQSDESEPDHSPPTPVRKSSQARDRRLSRSSRDQMIRKSAKVSPLWNRVSSPMTATPRSTQVTGPMYRKLISSRTPPKESVDSDLFDSGPFRPSYALGTYNTHGGAPYEISDTPIEVNESRKQQMQNRARLESQNDYMCLSPKVAAGLQEEMDARCKSPQLVEMHTFRDAVDVNYQRMAITGEELSGLPLEDLKDAATHLIEALRMRNQYMERIGNQFPVTTKRFLSGEYPANLPKYRRKNTESTANTSFNPPEPPKDHWGLNTPLPVFPVKYTLRRREGVVEVCDADGKLKPDFAKHYITKDQFLSDTERLTQMIVDGPLKSFCFRRLSYLQNKFQLHVLLNELRELHEQKAVSHRDFYNIRKVDTHIHAASSMNQKHLLRFIKKKIRTEADTVVLEKVLVPTPDSDVCHLSIDFIIMDISSIHNS
ncbi:hypothetical protein GCK32_004086 [Trichostrongylus colubriformis]|uniref:Uncharacterized protein n=1 Tax=Trichostrongylus colubriformis TaxID=6319 RepID=A0AAN8F1V4_TRICO